MLLASVISLLLLSGSLQENREGDVRVYQTTLHFRWNQTNYEENYLTNADAADKLCTMLEEIGMENIDSVDVVAFASPEGVYEHNMMLSRNRAREFNAAVRERLGLGGDSFRLSVRPGGEAWDLLRARVVADTVISETARSRVLKVLDDSSVSRDTKKWRMMHNALGATREEGDVYHWLLLNHYRYLRCLEVKIYIHGDAVIAPTEPAVPVEPEVPDEPVVPEEPVVPSEPEIPSEPESEPVTEARDTTTASAASAVMPPIPDQPATRQKGTPIIGISTNLLYDATYIPNYGFTSIPSFSLEYYPAKGHYTFGADLELSHWLHYPEHRFNQIHNLTIWTRRYFKPEPLRFNGPYVLASVNAAQYGIGWDQKGWEGEGLGMSVGGGYKWTFGRFFIDVGGSLGAFYSIYDPYVWGNDATGWYYYDYAGDPAKFTERRLRWFWFGPTRLQVSVGFDLFNRRK